MTFARVTRVLLVGLSLTCFLPAQEQKPEPRPEAGGVKWPLPPSLPADAHVDQTIQLDGKPIKYTATVGTLRTKNAENKPTGEVVFTSYVVQGANRPVTFAFNGGPGAASVYLNLGAIGPKRVAFGSGESPSDPATLSDNPGTWLDFTDLVLNRSDRHRIQPVSGLPGRDEEAVLSTGPGHRLPFENRL